MDYIICVQYVPPLPTRPLTFSAHKIEKLGAIQGLGTSWRLLQYYNNGLDLLELPADSVEVGSFVIPSGSVVCRIKALVF